MDIKLTVKRASRLAVATGFFAVAYFWIDTVHLPRLGFSGLVGLVNVTIIGYLLVLAIRYFVFLFFSMREEARREFLEPATEFPLISIIVPAYNEGILIRRTVEVLGQIDYPSFEIIVIDDGSSDDTYEQAREMLRGEKRLQVHTKANGGKSTALNFGIAKAKGEFIFCMDADSLVMPQSLRQGIRHFADPAIAAVAGAVLVLNQGKLLSKFQALEYMTGLNFFKSAQSAIGLVTIIPGPSGLFRKNIVQGLGGYLSDTFAEDADLSMRILMAGHRVAYEPDMEVRTEVPEAAIDLIKQRYRWNRGILQALKKHFFHIFTPFSNPVAFLIVAQMIGESIVLPTINLTVAILTLLYQMLAQDFSLFSLWLVVLTFLDLSLVVLSLRDLRWPLDLLFYSLINRFTYAFFQDVIKMLSSVEEILGIRMNWGKLDRIGSAS